MLRLLLRQRHPNSGDWNWGISRGPNLRKALAPLVLEIQALRFTFALVIRYDPKNWFKLIFHAYSKQVTRKLMPGMIGIAILTAGVCYLELVHLDKPWNISNTVHSLLGFVLSLFLVFRTNSAYDRWWEGRKQWGTLVNTCRTLAIRVRAFLPAEDHAWFAAVIKDFPPALRDHLRSISDREKLEGESVWGSGAALKHLPNELTLKMTQRVNERAASGAITGDQQRIVEGDLERLLNVTGACERILRTPIPYSYSMFMKKFIFLYAITLPLGFVATFEWWTVPVVVIVFYLLVSIELIAEEIENPFGEDENDLPLDDISETISKNIKEILPVT